MARIDYNVSAKLRKLKKLAQSHFLAGNPVEVVAGVTGLSKDLLQEWHDEFLINTLKGSAPRRVFLRELLLKNAPQMILILTQLAQNKGDEKLAYSASSAVLSFASRFMNEDAKILQAEQKFNKENDNDPLFRRTLFDLADPDVNGAKKEDPTAALFARASAGEEEMTDETLEHVLAAIERLEEKGLLPSEEQPTRRAAEPAGGSEDYKGETAVDLFEGIDD